MNKEYEEIPNGYFYKEIAKGCYLMDDKIHVYKEIPTFDEQKILELKDLPKDKFAFPIDFIYEKGKFVGYTMDYIPGTSLGSLDLSIKLDTFIEMLFEFEKALINISEYSVLVIDLNDKNIIVTPELEIKAIDTTLYERNYSCNIKETARENVKDLFATIYHTFNFSLIKDEKIEEELNKASLGYILPSKFLRFLKNYYLDKEIISVYDLKEAINPGLKR